MDYTLGTVRRANIPAHDDIETDILTQQNGLYTFTLRIDGGNIVDYNVVQYVNVNEYFSDQLVIKELALSQYIGKGGTKDSIRDDNG